MNCASATPSKVNAAPASLMPVYCSPANSQATRPATGGIKYISGAVRATPRTALIQPQTSQPRKADTVTDQTGYGTPSNLAEETAMFLPFFK